MSNGQVYTMGLWSVKPGNEAALIAAWEKFAKWSAENQPGAMEAVLLQDLEQPRRFVSIGPWEDAEKVRAWRQRPEFQAFFSRAKELCEEIQPRTLKPVARAAQPKRK